MGSLGAGYIAPLIYIKDDPYPSIDPPPQFFEKIVPPPRSVGGDLRGGTIMPTYEAVTSYPLAFPGILPPPRAVGGAYRGCTSLREVLLALKPWLSPLF